MYFQYDSLSISANVNAILNSSKFNIAKLIKLNGFYDDLRSELKKVELAMRSESSEIDELRRYLRILKMHIETVEQVIIEHFIKRLKMTGSREKWMQTLWIEMAVEETTPVDE